MLLKHHLTVTPLSLHTPYTRLTAPAGPAVLEMVLLPSFRARPLGMIPKHGSATLIADRIVRYINESARGIHRPNDVFLR